MREREHKRSIDLDCFYLESVTRATWKLSKRLSGSLNSLTSYVPFVYYKVEAIDARHIVFQLFPRWPRKKRRLTWACRCLIGFTQLPFVSLIFRIPRFYSRYSLFSPSSNFILSFFLFDFIRSYMLISSERYTSIRPFFFRSRKENRAKRKRTVSTKVLSSSARARARAPFRFSN